MNWFTSASLAYFLIALQSILDKFLLSSRRVASPATYAFYSGALSLTAVFLFPFGFHLIGARAATLEIGAGAIFTYGVLFLFFALRDHEASQTIPVVGAVAAVATYIFSLIFLDEHLSTLSLWGVAVLIIGGVLISLDFSPRAIRRIFRGFEHSVLAGIFLAFSYVWFKNFFLEDNFVNVYIWTRMGLMAGALSLLLVPSWRKNIFNSLFRWRSPQRQDKHSGAIFILNKALGGVGSFLLNYSISLGSVTIINALVSLEYVFIFILAYMFFKWVGNIFKERKDFLTLVQKFAAIVIITGGMVLVSR